jgi:hypothetical protein
MLAIVTRLLATVWAGVLGGEVVMQLGILRPLTSRSAPPEAFRVPAPAVDVGADLLAAGIAFSTILLTTLLVYSAAWYLDVRRAQERREALNEVWNAHSALVGEVSTTVDRFVDRWNASEASTPPARAHNGER